MPQPGLHVVDRREWGKLSLRGTDAKAFLDGQLSNAVLELEPGRGMEAALLTPKGKMLALVRVLDLGDELLLLTERSALQALFDRIRTGLIGWDAHLHKRTLQDGLLSLLGPSARELAGAPAGPLHAHAPGPHGLAVVTDLGADVVCPAEDTDRAKAALVAAGAVEVSEAEADVARVELGLPRFGVDLAPEDVIPQEAGLNDRVVSFTKACYVGQETVARLRWKGRPNRHLRGLALSAPVPTGTPLQAGEREVGRLTSVVESPRHGPIGLALVRREVEPGAEVRAGEATATVVDLPFGHEAHAGVVGGER